MNEELVLRTAEEIKKITDEVVKSKDIDIMVDKYLEESIKQINILCQTGKYKTCVIINEDDECKTICDRVSEILVEKWYKVKSNNFANDRMIIHIEW